MQANGNGSRRIVSEINVTPLVDVMLVLLIIFMVTAPMMTQGVDVKLPESSAPAIPSDDERLVVTVTEDRKVYINDNVVEPEELESKLAGLIRQAGIDQIGMVTEPAKNPAPNAQRKGKGKI